MAEEVFIVYSQIVISYFFVLNNTVVIDHFALPAIVLYIRG